MATERTLDQQTAYECGYDDEMAGAPYEAAPARFTSGELFRHYNDGRTHALNDLINKREAAAIAEHERLNPPTSFARWGIEA